MSTRTLNIALPKELVEKIDFQASLEYASRSEYIRRAVLNQLRRDGAFKRVAAPDPATLKELKRAQLQAFLSKESRHKSDFKEDVD